ncbi:ABC transporter ATP-binding protein [bacterium]|nr:ABC transporter ATP-binding protein [bacterium]
MTAPATQSDGAPLPLRVRGVGKRYGPLWALRGVSLDLPPGSIVGLLGPNGAGKTTLIRICAGWLEPDEGDAQINGIRQSPSELATRRCMGIVSRDAPLYDEFSVIETLRLHAVLQGMTARAATDAVSRVIDEYRLDEFSRRRVGVLSTGMRQRTAIACALLHDPAVLLLDEPTVGLDPDVRRHIWECLATAAARGVAILLTTHYFDEAVQLCQHVHLLVAGAIARSLAPGTDGAASRALEEEYFTQVKQERPR